MLFGESRGGFGVFFVKRGKDGFEESIAILSFGKSGSPIGGGSWIVWGESFRVGFEGGVFEGAIFLSLEPVVSGDEVFFGPSSEDLSNGAFGGGILISLLHEPVEPILCGILDVLVFDISDDRLLVCR